DGQVASASKGGRSSGSGFFVMSTVPPGGTGRTGGGRGRRRRGRVRLAAVDRVRDLGHLLLQVEAVADLLGPAGRPSYATAE
ncbi:hypothetical protein STRTUCAR8_07272, partial [Streptomyces turgidiscabies Car8]